jgi:hypothetical protein
MERIITICLVDTKVGIKISDDISTLEAIGALRYMQRYLEYETLISNHVKRRNLETGDSNAVTSEAGTALKSASIEPSGVAPDRLPGELTAKRGQPPAVSGENAGRKGEQ